MCLRVCVRAISLVNMVFTSVKMLSSGCHDYEQFGILFFQICLYSIVFKEFIMAFLVLSSNKVNIFFHILKTRKET